jgi:LAO/AO transport system kinase
LMDAAGRDLVLLETVGVGQAEVDIIDHADTVVLVLMPGSGDSIQALKAGVMEIPDVIVVNKAEHPLTDAMVREIKMVLALGPHREWTVPVLRSEAVTGAGIPELADTLDTHRAHLQQQGILGERRRRNLMGEVLAIATQRMRRELEASLRDDASVQQLLDRVADRELDPASAATEILARRSRATGA